MGPVKFHPALSLQRQTFLLEALRDSRPKSVLDIGCGEGTLLECLVRCDDFIPVEVLVGIDISEAQLQTAARIMLVSANIQQQDERWHPLDIQLLRGSFTQLAPDSAAVFDTVVSSEVIEHLDPPELALYWEIHLGVLQPNKLIVTTPNREFNALFDEVEKGSEAVGRTYTREGVPYRMRHEDHRFEYTRDEFQDESRRAAQQFGYGVSFTGVGTAYNVLNECLEFLEKNPHLRELGYCTQIAIFTRPEFRSIPVTPVLTGNFEVIIERHFPRNNFDEYPPSPEALAACVAAVWRVFQPNCRQIPSAGEIRPPRSASSYLAKYQETNDLILCCVPLSALWDFNYSLEKLFRYNKDLYMEVGGKLEHKEYDNEFVGLVSSGLSLKGYQFLRIGGEMHIVYQFGKEMPRVLMPDELG